MDPLSRAQQLFVAAGPLVADVAYFYGEDSNVTALFADKAPAVPGGYNFDFINADTVLTALKVEQGAIVAPSGMTYRVLALDSNAQYMSLPVLKRLGELVAAGATIVGARPTDTPSLADDAREFAALAATVWGDGSGRHAYGKGQSSPANLWTRHCPSLESRRTSSTTNPRPILHCCSCIEHSPMAMRITSTAATIARNVSR